MNTTALYYDELAASYNMADNFGSISLSHEAAIEQIQQKQIGHANTQLRVLDMGVGDAAFLKNFIICIRKQSSMVLISLRRC